MFVDDLAADTRIKHRSTDTKTWKLPVTGVSHSVNFKYWYGMKKEKKNIKQMKSVLPSMVSHICILKKFLTRCAAVDCSCSLLIVKYKVLNHDVKNIIKIKITQLI